MQGESGNQLRELENFKQSAIEMKKDMEELKV